MKHITCILLIFVSFPLWSEMKTYLREYTYSASDNDSKVTANIIALNHVKRILLEEVGVFIQSEMTITKEENKDDYRELTTHQITAISAGILQTKIINEKWDGKEYYIKVSITVDPDDIYKQISRIANDNTKLKELESIKGKAEKAMAEIERLKIELSMAKTENLRLTKRNEYLKNTNNLTSIEWFYKGFYAFSNNDVDNSIIFYQKAIEFNPQLLEAYLNLGIIFDSKGDYQKAIQYTQKVIDLDPKFVVAVNNIGTFYDHQNDFEKAIEYFEKAIEINPNYPDPYFNLGSVYNNNGSVEKGILYWEKTINIDPRYELAYFYLALAHQYMGNLEQAILNYQKVKELNPSNLQVYNNLGTIYISKGNFEEAEKYFRDLLKIDPDYGLAYYNIGLIYFEKKKNDVAIEMFQKSIELNPKYTRAFWLLALVYEQMGDKVSMLQAMKNAAKNGDLQSQEWLKQNGYEW